MARLIILTGPKRGMVIELHPPQVVIGRDPGCDVVIAAEWISRRHCRLLQAVDQWLLEDLGSTNGVLVNNEPVAEAVVLKSEDRIAIGSLLFEFDPESGGRGMSAGAGEVQHLASDTQVATSSVWQDLSSEIGSVEIGARDIEIVREPELDFHVALAAKLQTEEQITKNGRVKLKDLARRGMLAADTPFPGRYTGRFRRVSFLLLDSYDLVGRAGYTLRVGLQLPIAHGDEGTEYADADVEFRAESCLEIRRREGTGVLASVLGDPVLGKPTCTLSAAEGMLDADATRYLVTEAASGGKAGPYDLSYSEMLDGLDNFCRICADVEDLEIVLRDLCTEAANAYRRWYSERWQEKTQWHDSQMPVGELRYRFDHDRERLGRPKAMAVTSVYRWL